MRATSHRVLGQHLVREYLAHWPASYSAAFLLGCVQPDKNPSTYLKGSLRSQLLRGHNWENSRIYIQKLCHRLERRQHYSLSDAYALGKLMHYLADSFTYAHNAPFCTLKDHRSYEARLESHFLKFMLCPQAQILPHADTPYATITNAHKQYIPTAGSVQTDTGFIFSVTCRVMEQLLTKALQAAPA